jgi:hypothetical protein
MMLWQAHSEKIMIKQFMSANTHEPSADMTNAVASEGRENSDVSDVHEGKHP